MSDTIQELDIIRLGAQGDGVADTPAGPVYVARALAGERVRADVTGERGRLIDVIRASPDRVQPVCRHFGSCGGCAAQHMGQAPYRIWKRELVRTAFSHRGLEPPIDDVVLVPPGTRRRATFGAARRGGRLVLGFHEEGSHTLVDLEVCPVVVPAIANALASLRSIADVALSDDLGMRLTVTATPAGLDVALTSEGQLPLDAKVRARIAHMASVAGILRVTANGDLVIQSAAPKLVVGGAEVLLPPAAFIQATAEAEAAIGDLLVKSTVKAKRIVDLFSGVGTFTFGLAKRARVLAVDGEKRAIEALITAAKGAKGVKPIETRVRDLLTEPLSRQELDGFDAAVFDPPRAGARAQAEMLAKSKVPVVCAVSCNPATLARDCRILVDGGYQIVRVTPIDQFVWSQHVEAVAVLKRGR